VIARLVLVLVLALDHAARCETVIDIPRSKTQLVLDDAWTRIAQPDQAKDIIVLYKHTGGALLAVTRADVPNTDAWISEKKQAYADEVERGIKSKIAGYKRVAKKLADANRVPALDVEAKREGGASVVVRVLLFRTYALSLAIEVPKAGDIALARALIKTFAPPKDPPPGAAP